MKKNLKDNTKFKLTIDDVLWEARMRCMKEMYAKAQPSVDYDEIYEYYKQCQKEGKEPERVFERYYLSQEEFEYIRDKYIDVYHLHNPFKEHCNVIIDDMKNGCSKDKWIPGEKDDKGFEHPGHRGYEKVLPMKEQIGEEATNAVISFIENRRDFYRFNRDEERFSFDVCLTDSPSSSEKQVIEYWKEHGIELEIDPRHYTHDDFWCEDNGYLDDETEETDD